MSRNRQAANPSGRDFFGRQRLRQHLFAYAFLAIPLLLLSAFVYYPLLQGIYISFLDYQLPKSPVIGGPIAFIRTFLANLPSAPHATLSVLLLLASLCVLGVMLMRRVSWKAILPTAALALAVNLVPLGPVLARTMREINYCLEDDRTVGNDDLPGTLAMMRDLYGRDAQIIEEPVHKDETRVIVKRSIWVGPAVYRSILPNPQFVAFVKRSAWYIWLLCLPILGLLALRFMRSRRRRNEVWERRLKLVTGATVLLLLAISWPRIFHDQTWPFYNALRNSLKYVLVVPPLQVAAILLAILVNQKLRGVAFFRTLYYVPVITGVVIIGYCWKFVYMPGGLLDSWVRMLHLTPPAWLGDRRLALFSTMFVTFWRGLGYYMVLYLAGLQDIPRELIEAARVDGASTLRLITGIYLPLLRRIILVCTVISTMAALRVFEEIYVLSAGSTGSAPMNGTVTMVYLIYDRAFGQFGLQFSHSAALAVILSVIIAVFTVFNFRLERGMSR